MLCAQSNIGMLYDTRRYDGFSSAPGTVDGRLSSNRGMEVLPSSAMWSLLLFSYHHTFVIIFIVLIMAIDKSLPYVCAHRWTSHKVSLYPSNFSLPMRESSNFSLFPLKCSLWLGRRWYNGRRPHAGAPENMVNTMLLPCLGVLAWAGGSHRAIIARIFKQWELWC